MTMSSETRDAVREGAKRSAAAVLPFVFETLGTPSAMLDVGAGEGHWLKAAMQLGVQQVAGADVDPLDSIVSEWDAEGFQSLSMRLEIGHHVDTGASFSRWPLALCLETAEHLTPTAGDHLVSELCRVATEIVWSAAIPGQGGDGHINEQWPAYWAERFEQHGFVLDDPGWRLDLWDHPDAEPWYAQNLLCAFRPDVLVSSAIVRPLALVHPVTWAHHRGVPAPDRS